MVLRGTIKYTAQAPYALTYQATCKHHLSFFVITQVLLFPQRPQALLAGKAPGSCLYNAEQPNWLTFPFYTGFPPSTWVRA